MGCICRVANLVSFFLLLHFGQCLLVLCAQYIASPVKRPLLPNGRYITIETFKFFFFLFFFKGLMGLWTNSPMEGSTGDGGGGRLSLHGYYILLPLFLVTVVPIFAWTSGRPFGKFWVYFYDFFELTPTFVVLSSLSGAEQQQVSSGFGRTYIGKIMIHCHDFGAVKRPRGDKVDHIEPLVGWRIGYHTSKCCTMLKLGRTWCRLREVFGGGGEKVE